MEKAIWLKRFKQFLKLLLFNFKILFKKNLRSRAKSQTTNETRTSRPIRRHDAMSIRVHQKNMLRFDNKSIKLGEMSIAIQRPSLHI